MVDLVGHLFEGIAHRIVGNGGEVDDAVDAFQVLQLDIAYIAVILEIDPRLGEHIGAGQAVAEKAGVEADEFDAGIGLAQGVDQGRTDVSHVSGNQNFFHSLVFLVTDCFQDNRRHKRRRGWSRSSPARRR